MKTNLIGIFKYLFHLFGKQRHEKQINTLLNIYTLSFIVYKINTFFILKYSSYCWHPFFSNEPFCKWVLFVFM